MFLFSLWHALFTALLSAGMVAFALITRLERTAAVRASPPRLRRRSLLLTALGVALATLPFDPPAAHRLWLPPAAALLIALAWLDWRHRWLPDRLTQPLLWGGLLCNLDARWAPLNDAVIGAAAGYGALWLLNALYRQLRRRNGIGRRLQTAGGAGRLARLDDAAAAGLPGGNVRIRHGIGARPAQPSRLANAATFRHRLGGRRLAVALAGPGQNAPALFGEFFSVSLSRLSNPATSAVLAVAGLASGWKT
ncbi:A24 family peptidase [Serratia ureilytica]